MPMVTKLGKTVTYLDRLQPIKLRYPSITWYARSHDNLKSFTSTTTVPMVTKLGKLVTCHEWIPLFIHSLVTWSCKIT